MTPAAPWYVLRHIGTKRYRTMRPHDGYGASYDLSDANRYETFALAEAARQYLREFADTYEVMQLPAEQP